MIMQFCPNGARTPGAHPALPATPVAVAADVVTCASLGINDVHVHPKNDAGTDSIAAEHVARFIDAIRDGAPSTPVGVTTGAWTASDLGQRVAAIRSWRVRPDHASVNWHEDGADEVADTLLDQGVAVHAGLFTATDAVDRFLASAFPTRVARVLVEVTEPAPAQGLRAADETLARLAQLDVPILLHGEGATCWPVFSRAVQLGLDTRIGLEDTVTLPDGSPAPDNAALVRYARSTRATGSDPSNSASGTSPA
jgi:uncharacterized protein (DUF849 family)